MSITPLPGGPSPIIRNCHPEDFAEVAAVYNEYILSGHATMDSICKTAKDIETMVNHFTHREILLVMVQDDSVIGFGLIKAYSERLGYRVCCETSVYLRGSHVGLGLGTRMKKVLIQHCKEFGYHHLVGKVLADNLASIRCNQKVGFEVVGRQREIGYRNGQWLDVVILQLILDDVPPYLPELI